MTTLISSRSDTPAERIARAVGRARAPTRVLGIEHEFGVFDGDEQLDFRDIIHDLPIREWALHPTNPHMYFTDQGSALIADGMVAEAATPPTNLTRGECIQQSLEASGRPCAESGWRARSCYSKTSVSRAR